MLAFILLSFLGPFLLAKLVAPIFFIMFMGGRRNSQRIKLEEILKMILNANNLNSGRYKNYSNQNNHYNNQHSRPNFNKNTNKSDMTIEEARKILGVSESDSADTIKQNYRALMQKMHPDKGGSEYLCKKINEAKKVLCDN